MSNKLLTILLIIGLAVLMAAPSIFADRRKYAWTYQTTTLAEGSSEIELYQTTKVNENSPDKWEYKIEFEHGLSPRFDIGIYQIFTQTQGESFKWDAVQFRGRYRFGLPGDLIFDPILYFEYRRKIEHVSGQNKFEAKILLGKDFDKFNFSVNPVFEYLWAHDYDSYQEIGLDAGLSYAPSFNFSIGVESTTRKYFYSEAGKEDKYKTSFGPTVSYAAGHTFYTVGIAFGLNDKADDSQVRFLMGIGI